MNHAIDINERVIAMEYTIAGGYSLIICFNVCETEVLHDAQERSK